MHTYMDLRLREQEREQREQREEREGEGESESTVDRLVCLAADDSSADDSASAASTTQLFVTIFALVRGLRSHVPCCWSMKVRRARDLRGGQHSGSRHSYSLTGLQLEGTTGTRDSTVLDVPGHV
jgi:hypothetical protein